MAPSPPPLQAEDQTDEQFFDKLVDDEYGAAQSHLKPEDTARALSNLSLVEMDDSGSASEVNGLKDNQYLNSSASSKNDASIGEAQSEVFSKGASGGPKGASVKEIQWSALSVNSEQFELGDFESDLLSGTGYGSLANPQSFSEPKAALIENTSENIISRVGYYEQQDAQVYSSVNEQSADLTEMENWETLYPGWKYDSITEQWFQVDGYDATSNIQSDNFSIVSANTHESSGTKVQNAFEESVSEISGVLNHQQTSYPVLETISEESNLLNSWNQVSQGSIYYPSNMVFDPQYPEWYYDTITQMWYTLESYNHALHDASNATQDPQTTNVNALTGLSIHDHHVSYGSQAQSGQYMVLEQSNQKSHWDASASGFGKQNMWQEQNGQEGHWNASDSGYDQKKMWKPELYIKNEDAISFSNDHLTGSFYGSQEYTRSHLEKQLDTINLEPRVKHNLDQSSITASRGYVTSENMYHYNQPNMEQSLPAHLSNSNYGTESSINYVQQSFQGANPSYSQISYAPNEGRSTAGRPPHALVSFGFGGKILVLKASFSSSSFVSGSQGTVGGAVLIHSLVDVVMAETDFLNRSSAGGFSYFHTLCQQSFPGPLVGGNAASKDINKWIDDRIMSSESSSIDFENGLLLRLLLSLLKISCQHYGKLRSPYGIEPSHEGSDNPESAVSKLFASAKRNDIPFGGFDYSMHCIKNPPSEGNIRAAAIEVQNLLVSGRRKEALQRAQEGQLWGPALVLAAQLGEQFYVDSVKQMALRQFVYGSPLRTLCLLIAGQPADVFSADSSSSALSGAVNGPYQSSEVLRNSMLDDWQENLAIITSNKTNDDELVIIHLGDCLWKERGEVTAAHTCYLVAEANFEPYSDSARLCLIGADHLKNPRTYVCPDAIQRTEIYEYSKVIGNSQFVLLPFQPYKLVYAYMLAEVGKVSDSLKYCLASVKMLKNSGRSPEVQSWRTLLSSLEERLRTHQQGGYGTNLAPTKLVGKLFNSIDRSIHRMIGAPPLPPMLQNSGDGRDNNSLFQKISGSQSTLAITTLTPSSSVEAIGQWTVDSSRKVAPNRSISEPDFGRSTKQGNASMSGVPSRFGLFGSQLLQKTIGWVSLSKQDRQAKLGESNKFYYDEKLKRWVEEGADLPAANASLPSPPPTAASFQNGISEYDVKNASLTTDPVRETKLDAPSEQGAGLPPMPTSQNQFSARSRVGVRSRYVDTFNKGGGSFTNSFQPLSAPSVKPLAGANFFIPAAPTNYEDKTNDATRESIHDTIIDEPSTSTIQESTFSPSATPSSSSIQRFPSMDNIASSQILSSGDSSVSRARAASWSGAYAHISNTKVGMERHSSVVSGVASTFAPQNDASLQVHAGGSVIDDLHEVEL